MTAFSPQTRTAQLEAARAYLHAPDAEVKRRALVVLEALCWAVGDTMQDTALRVERRISEVRNDDQS